MKNAPLLVVRSFCALVAIFMAGCAAELALSPFLPAHIAQSGTVVVEALTAIALGARLVLAYTGRPDR